jgi:hypothetical protein
MKCTLLVIFIISFTLCFAQPSKNGFQLYFGLNAPQGYSDLPTFVNDSTTVFLQQNDEPRESVGFSFHRTINKRFKVFSQLFINESYINTNAYGQRYVFTSNGLNYYLTATYLMSYKFLTLNNLNGVSLNLGRYLELSSGLGIVIRDQNYKNHDFFRKGGGATPTVDDIATPLSNDIINKVSLNFGYSVSFHLKGLYKHFNGLYLTARYQESLTNESKGFEYAGTKYPLNGRASSYSLDLGYRFVARREKIGDGEEEKIRRTIAALQPKPKSSFTIFAGVNGFEYPGYEGTSLLANLNDSTQISSAGTGNFGHGGITYTGVLYKRFSFYSQLIVNPYSTGLQLDTKRTVMFTGGPGLQGTFTALEYKFLNFVNNNGFVFKIHKYFSVSAGLGLTYKAKFYEFNSNDVAANVRDVAATLNSSIFRQWDANAGYAFIFHLEEFQAALRFHKNLSNEWTPFDYRGRTYQLPGVFDGIYFDVGYRFSW